MSHTLLSDVQAKKGGESMLNSVFGNENVETAKLEKGEKDKKEKKAKK
jgi:hypothetical protein